MEVFFIKMGIATLLAVIIGIDREIKKKGLGLKTFVTITLTSCLLANISVEASFLYAETQIRVMDPLRVPSYIISGIGFLGAGVILRKQNDVISGLTTAALVWASAAIGITIGLGFYKEATITAVLIMLSVNFLPLIIKSFGPKNLREKKVRIRVIIEDDGIPTVILKAIKSKNMRITNVKVKDLSDGGYHQMDAIVYVDEKRYTTDVYERINEIDKVLRVEAEAL